MPDRMPQDLPVRKCINVMVGITRSKVIFHGDESKTYPAWSTVTVCELDNCPVESSLIYPLKMAMFHNDVTVYQRVSLP